MTQQLRRLINWISVFAYTAFIYSTLSVTPVLSRFFSRLLGRGYSLSVNLFTVGLVFLLPVFLYKRLKRKPLWVYLALALTAGLYALTVFTWSGTPAEKLHLVEYGFLSFLLLRAMEGVRPRLKKYAAIILSVALIGYVDELIQWFLPNRVCDIKDVALNVISGILGLIMAELLS